MTDPYRLQRFTEAQAPIFDQVLSELLAGQKQSHWMWFVFPQIKGLGHSPMAREFAISSLEEASAYLSHPLLGERLRECTGLVNAVRGQAIEQIFGYTDAMKFRSSMTLFSRASSGEQVFNDALRTYFDGEPDALTLERIGPG